MKGEVEKSDKKITSKRQQHSRILVDSKIFYPQILQLIDPLIGLHMELQSLETLMVKVIKFCSEVLLMTLVTYRLLSILQAILTQQGVARLPACFSRILPLQKKITRLKRREFMKRGDARNYSNTCKKMRKLKMEKMKKTLISAKETQQISQHKTIRNISVSPISAAYTVILKSNQKPKKRYSSQPLVKSKKKTLCHLE